MSLFNYYKIKTIKTQFLYHRSFTCDIECLKQIKTFKVPIYGDTDSESAYSKQM